MLIKHMLHSISVTAVQMHDYQPVISMRELSGSQLLTMIFLLIVVDLSLPLITFFRTELVVHTIRTTH